MVIAIYKLMSMFAVFLLSPYQKLNKKQFFSHIKCMLCNLKFIIEFVHNMAINTQKRRRARERSILKNASPFFFSHLFCSTGKATFG